MDFWSTLWSILSFLLSLAWSVIWFVLRDLVSTTLWIVIVAWLVLSVRYRSFSAGAWTLLRYAGFGLGLFWQWLRGRPRQPLASIPAKAEAKAANSRTIKKFKRIPLGYMSVSEQLNVLLLLYLVALFYV